MRPERRRDLLRLLRAGKARSQLEIVEALRSAGHNVTQTTVSRDLRAIGAIKSRSEDGVRYVLAEDERRAPDKDLNERNLVRTLAEFAIEIRAASSLVVVLTAPGHAAIVARAVDLSGVREVVGSVAGDDTIFVATPGPRHAAALARRWSDTNTNLEVAR
ncbi:MAG: arginine repressor [Actinomycetota bacterium]|nr:arginine repressor [Actinomycetota bacterium]